jgi:hypothetical protein
MDELKWLINNGVGVAIAIWFGFENWRLKQRIEALEKAAVQKQCLKGGGVPRPCETGRVMAEGSESDSDAEIPIASKKEMKPHGKKFPASSGDGSMVIRRGVKIGVIVVFIALVVLFGGCSATRQERQVSRQTGTQNGEPVELVTVTETKEETSGGVDIGAALSAALQASQGKILGALEKLKPAALPEFPSVGAIAQAVHAQQPEKGTDWGTIGGGLIVTILIGLATAKAREAQVVRKEKESIEKDRDFAYENWLAANRELPPK